MTRGERPDACRRQPRLPSRRAPANATANYCRQVLDRMLETIVVELFTPADILAYGAIVYDLGYDRRTTLDRLIAAQAISRDARLITRNRRDFERIEGLRLEVWPGA
jgi:predicted nucleic acid-binding protein